MNRLRAGARDEGPLGRPVGHLAGRLLAGRRRTATPSRSGTSAPASSTKKVAELLARALRPVLHPAARLGEGPGREARRQDQHLRRRHGQLLPEQRRVSRRGVPRRARRTRPTAARSTTATGPSTAGTATTRGRTRSRGCATTSSSRRRSSSGSSKRRRKVEMSGAGDTSRFKQVQGSGFRVQRRRGGAGLSRV